MKILLSLAILASTCCGCLADVPFIDAVGNASAETPADRAVIRVYIEARNERIEKSNSSVDLVISKLSAFLKSLGVAESLQTTEYKISTRVTERHGDSQKITFEGFETRSRVLIDLRALQYYPTILTYLSTNEGFSGLSVTLSTEKEGEIRRRLVVEAVRAAKAKALAIAEDNMLLISGLISAYETSSQNFGREEGGLYGNYSGRPSKPEGALSVTVSVEVRAKFESKNQPNQPSDATPGVVTSAAEQPLVPAPGVPHLSSEDIRR